VSESNLPPEQWRPYFDQAGIEFGYRPLAARAGLTHTRVHRLIRGGGTTAEAIDQVAAALGVKASKVRELRGEAAVEVDPFTLPDDAGRLTESERDVVRRVVRALLDARDRHDQPAADEADPSAEESRASSTEDKKIKPFPLRDGGSRREALPGESPDDAIAARRLDPKFGFEDEGADGIGEENQDTGWDE